MPELHKIGSILVAVASLSTFFFATKELLLNPPMNHHGRQLAVEPAMGFDPKTISYKDTTVNTVADQAAGYTGAMATTTTTTGTARRSEPMLQDHPMRPQLAYGTANTEQQGESSTGDAGGEALKDTSTFGDVQTGGGGGLATATTLSRDGTGGFGDSSAGETQSGGFGASSNVGTQQAGGFGASSNGGMQQSGGFGTSAGGTQQAGASSNGGTQQAGGFGASSNGGTQQAGGFGASSNGGMQQSGGFGASSNVAGMSEQQGVGMMQQQTGMQTGQSQTSSRRRLEFVHITKTGTLSWAELSWVELNV
jgi:hypothetical protein